MVFVKETSPHIKRKDSLKLMLLNVIIALLPVFIWSFVVYPIPALQIYPIAIATCVLCEFLFVLIVKKDKKEFKIENLLSSIITGLIYSMCLPTDLGFASGTGYFVVFAGAALGIVLGKLVFGGIGNNIFNPAALGMIIVRLGWGGISGNSTSPTGFITELVIDGKVQTGATALTGTTASTLTQVNLGDLFLGRTPGSLGETFHIAILIGLVFLLITRTLDWRTLVSYMGTFAILMLCAGIVVQCKVGTNFGYYALYQMLSGGFLFGSVYMITDPVTGPVGSPARWVFGAFGAMVAVFIRLFCGTEGVGYSILCANIIASVLDYPEWASSKWKKWHIISLASIVCASILIVVLVLSLKEGAVA